MKLAQFQSPKTKPCPPLTNRDWAGLVAKRDQRTGIRRGSSR